LILRGLDGLVYLYIFISAEVQFQSHTRLGKKSHGVGGIADIVQFSVAAPFDGDLEKSE
jgi:hypothetical protein